MNNFSLSIFQIWQAILSLQVTEWDIFMLSIYCLSKLIFNWMFCVLFATSGLACQVPPACSEMARVFTFALGGIYSFGCVLGENCSGISSHCGFGCWGRGQISNQLNMTSPMWNVLLLGISERINLSGAIVRSLSVMSPAGKASFQASGKSQKARAPILVINGNGVSQVGCGEIYYNRKPDGASCPCAAPARFLSPDERPEASNAA